jgi:hypothetical protein
MEQHFDYDSLMEYCKEKFGDVKPKQVPDDIFELIERAGEQNRKQRRIQAA